MAESDVVATEPNLAGTPLVVVQYARLLMTSPDEVASWFESVIVPPRATVPPPLKPVPVLTVTEVLVKPREPELFVSPVPARLLKD